MSDYIPPEVVVQILDRLPIKSLVRLRCVCKEWYNLIYDPNFITRHLSYSLASTNKPTIVKYQGSSGLGSESGTSLEMYAVYDNAELSGTPTILENSPLDRYSIGSPKFVVYCNGLVAVFDTTDSIRNRLLIWNPSIKRALGYWTAGGELLTSLPSVSAAGLGFVSVTNEFKFVHVCYFSYNNDEEHGGGVITRVRSRVFSLSSGLWRTIRYRDLIEGQPRMSSDCMYQVVIDGVVHWIGYKTVELVGGRKTTKNVIVKFDLGVEKLGDIGLPRVVAFARARDNIILVRLRELLSVAKITDDNDTFKSCAIWVMNDYGDIESWAQLYVFELREGIGRVLGVRTDGEILLSIRSGELVFYNTENGNCRYTGIFGKENSFFVDDYVESLILLGKRDEDSGKQPNQHPFVDADHQPLTRTGACILFLIWIIFYGLWAYGLIYVTNHPSP